MVRRFILFAVLAILCLPSEAEAYDILGKQESNLGVQRVQLFAGMGLSSLVSNKGIEADSFDLGYRIGVGYSFTRQLRIDFLYHFASVPITSPNPLNGSPFNSHVWFHSEIWRFLYRFDHWTVNPYLFLGLGLYQVGAVNPLTGLGFSTSLQMPFGAGLEVFLFGDDFSLSCEYLYHLLFDEEQDAGVLALLGVNEVSFDVQTISINLFWHFF